MLLGLGNSFAAGLLIDGLAREEIAGLGYVFLASLAAFTAVGQAARLALLATHDRGRS